MIYDAGASRADLADWYSNVSAVGPAYSSTDWGAVIEGDGAAHTYAIWGRAWTINANAYWSGNCRFYIEDVGPVVGDVQLPVNPTPPWIPLTLTSPWTTNPWGFFQPAWRMVGDRVELRGLTTAGTLAATTILTLPVAARPPSSLMFTSWMSWNSAGGRGSFRLDVLNSGQINHSGLQSLQGGTTSPAVTTFDHLSLDGINFSVTP